MDIEMQKAMHIQKKKTKPFTWVVLWIFLWIGGMVAFATPRVQNFLVEKDILQGSVVIEQNKALNEISQMYNILNASYFHKDELSLSWMREWAVRWFVSAVEDPHTEYFTIKENEQFATSLVGEEDFEWIGAAVTKNDKWIQIQEVYKWTPAALVWLQPLDVILSIDELETNWLSLQEAVDHIRGPKDTSVKLLIYRENRKEEWDNGVFVVEPIRKKVEIPSVEGEIIPVAWWKWNICFVEISVIGEITNSALEKELLACAQQNILGYVIDLRGNGGWYLEKWVDIAAHFLPKDKTVVSTKYSVYPDESFSTKVDGEYLGKPIVVLVDALTASAGEIIAGALQQGVAAKLVGTTTFWKWSIQTVAEVGSGSALKYTIGMRYLPDDTNIDGEGIKPDVEVKFDTEAYQKDMTDNQKNAAITELEKMLQ